MGVSLGRAAATARCCARMLARGGAIASRLRVRCKRSCAPFACGDAGECVGAACRAASTRRCGPSARSALGSRRARRCRSAWPAAARTRETCARISAARRASAAVRARRSLDSAAPRDRRRIPPGRRRRRPRRECGISRGAPRKDRGDGLRKSDQPVDQRDEDVVHAAALELRNHPEPEPRAFGLLDPKAHDVLVAVAVDAQGAADRIVPHHA